MAGAIVALSAAFGSAKAQVQAQPCEALGAGTRIGVSTIVSARLMPAGPDGLPSYCRLLAIAKPKPSSHIVIEIGLPLADKWNGRLLGVGNGGAAGSIGPQSLQGGLRRGFAVVTTDMGSHPAAMADVGFSFGNGRPEAIRDWAHRSTHEMTVLAKALIQRYYGRPQERAYFEGLGVGAPAKTGRYFHSRFPPQPTGGWPPAV
jgi:feruloyl esterase